MNTVPLFWLVVVGVSFLLCAWSLFHVFKVSLITAPSNTPMWRICLLHCLTTLWFFTAENMANSAERWGAKSAVYEYEHLDFPPLYVLSEKLYARNLDTVDARVFSYSAQEIYPDMVRAVVIMPKGQFKFKEVIVP